MLDISTTNFPNGISSFGMPTFGVGGMLPFTGRYIFVDATLGNDGNPGTANNPVATLSQALTLCGSGNKNDVIFLTGTVSITSTLTWSLNKTHLIGLTAPSNNARARISGGGSTVFTPFVNVTGQGCIFANIATFYGYANASAQICWADAGGRNYYSNCDILGMGDATAAAQAGARNLKITGEGENVFENCRIGLDTVTRSAANASLEFASGTARNTFRNCTFSFQTSASTPLGIIVSAAAGSDRWQLFDRCVFINNVQSTSTTMSGLATLAASMGGLLLMKDCTLVGITEFGTDATSRGQIYVDGGTVTAATSGIAVNPT